MATSLSPQQHRSRFGDTTLTKVFVGGLAWETPTQELRRHFEQFGEILEAIIIADKNTGRSKGYGFVTFGDPEAARRSVADPNPIIDGRRANCNVASVGRPQPSPPRGRNQKGSIQQGRPQITVPQYTRVPAQMAPHSVFYPTPYGYMSYPSGYAYQQGMFNPQVASQFYQQNFENASSSNAGAQPYPYPYAGYAIQSPRLGFQSSFQAHRLPYIQYPTAPHIEGAVMPSLPYGFQLQAPPNARQPSNTAESQTPHQSSTTGANTESPDG